jgi:Fe2+ transport system protein FeoA
MSGAVISLAALRPGERGRVQGGEAGHPATPRLLAMGLLPGTEITVLQVAPLGDPVEVEFRGLRLSLRKADAAAVRVETPAPAR